MNLRSKLPFFIQQAKSVEEKEPIWVKYLESDGNQYIDTGVIITSSNYRKEITLSNVSAGAGSLSPYAVMGSQTVAGGSARNPYLALNTSNKLAVGYATTAGGTSPYTFDNPTSATSFVLERQANTFTFTNGTTTYTVDYTGDKDVSGYTEWIFALNIDYSKYSASVRVYGYRLYIDDVLVRYMRPCLHPETRRPAMYDMVEKKYYYNQGTGEFKYEETFIKLDYIESDGNQYIKTGYFPDINVTEFDFEFMNLPQTPSLSGLFGSRRGYGSYSYNFFYSNAEVIQIDWDYQTTNRVTVPCVNYEKHVLAAKISEDGTKSYIYLDGVRVKESDASNPYKSNYDFWVGQFNNAGVSYTVGAPMRIYSLKITDLKILMRDYIPVRMNDGQFGLYDFITGQFYGNAGTGAFKGYIGDMQLGEYLESDSSAFIDTGVSGGNDNLAFNVTFQADKYTQYGAVFGNYIGNSIQCTRLLITAQDGNWMGAFKVAPVSGRWVGISATLGDKHTVYVDKTGFTVDGNKLDAVAQSGDETTAPIALFNRSVSLTVTRDIGLKIYSCQMYDSGAIIANMVPAKLADGRIGMWDFVRGKLFENQGTGEFVFE